MQPGVVCATWTTMDNTAMPQIIEFAKRLRGRMPDAMWRRNFLASWIAFIGQCFDLHRGRHFSRAPLLPSAIAKHLFRKCGFRGQGAYTAPGSRRAGMQWFQMATADDGWVMHDRAIYSRSEGLRHQDVVGDEAELWVKENDQGFDACRYALSPQIERGRTAVMADSDNLLGWMAR